ncbi:MAG: acyl-CoA desaturase [Burkholderiaceae bacterium]
MFDASQHPVNGARRTARAAILRWFDTTATTPATGPDADRVDLLRVLPFVALHLGCIAIAWVGVSTTAVVVAAVLYALRMFAITGFYHRYFSHKSFRTSRAVQFAFAVVGAASVQRGPLWWAAHHRHHHLHADTPQDAHSPRQGFWRSHMGWFLTPRHFATNHAVIPDLVRFPELRLLDRFDILVPVLLAIGLYGAGAWLGTHAPQLRTSGPQLLVWGFFVSTVVLFHVTVTINSLAHRWGGRRYSTPDDSRNNWILALLTFGEGWHNNHHHYPGSVRQGVKWWELDLTWYALKVLSWLGLVWDLRGVPASMRGARLARQ